MSVEDDKRAKCEQEHQYWWTTTATGEAGCTKCGRSWTVDVKSSFTMSNAYEAESDTRSNA